MKSMNIVFITTFIAVNAQAAIEDLATPLRLNLDQQKNTTLLHNTPFFNLKNSLHTKQLLNDPTLYAAFKKKLAEQVIQEATNLIHSIHRAPEITCEEQRNSVVQLTDTIYYFLSR